MHSSLPQQLRNFNFSHSKLLIGLFTFLERWAIQWSKAVITICPELQNDVDKLKVKTPHVLIENSICDVIDYADSGDVMSDDLINWEKFKGKKIILYSGTFEYYQGIPLLLECVRLVVSKRQDVVFILVGGTPQQLVTMRNMAQQLNVKDYVVLPGNIHPNTVKSFVKKADVLVSPRIHGTNTPLKIYEYLASGKPIIATKHQTHTQVLSGEEDMLADCDPDSFAHDILHVLQNPETYTQLSRNANDLYEKTYSSKIYMKRLRDVLSYVISDSTKKKWETLPPPPTSTTSTKGSSPEKSSSREKVGLK